MTINQQLADTIADIAIPGKGILAADESNGTIKKRFDTIGVESNEENRRVYRSLLADTPALEDYVSGVILFEETLDQKNNQGHPIPTVLANKNIVPGIKVDKGLVDLANAPGDKITQGLDGLADRLADYKTKGARFAKWRNVYNISNQLPSRLAISANAEVLARYAAICQSLGIVPIVEPECLIDGDHTIQRTSEVTEHVLHAVFHALHKHHVILENIILKPSMVVPGKDCPQQSDPKTIANMTLAVLKRAVPAAVPTINFLSGGQTPEEATINLNAMNAMGGVYNPWQLSFSYGRALQAPCLKAWGGQDANIQQAQQALLLRAKLNGQATLGQYEATMEAA